MNHPFGDWDGSVVDARRVQTGLAQQVVLRDDFAKPLRHVGGFDVGFEEDGTITRAAAILLDAGNLDVVANEVVRIPTTMPYVPGLLSFRELPALLAALERLPHPPDIAFVDGHGIAHPRRLGIAAHFGVATGLPSIGVAKKVLVGTSATALHDMRGAFTSLRDGGERIGWLLRSKVRCNPLIVSPGHRVSMASAPELVMRFTKNYRLPEPTRLADRLASRRGGTDSSSLPQP
ncbi:MAG: deoxyribonuclease V [Luteimonas sp.]|nr:deoxyribonuclease V [Luteimonas sp.]